jgi:hypothetical protein
MHAACEAEFPESHLCHVSEYLLSNSMTPLPTSAGAWIDDSASEHDGFIASGSVKFGRDHESGCDSWSKTAGSWYGRAVLPSGDVESKNCSGSRRLACCNGEVKSVFAGYTPGVTTGQVTDGRMGMHRMCHEAIPGSHFCHAAEYSRSIPRLGPPAAGAWVDDSETESGSFTGAGLPGAGRQADSGCNTWSASTGSWYGRAVRPEGNIESQNCANVRHVACCY